jgi:GT2 family glycosyltransferase
MEAQILPPAPAVVAVVVTCDPGPWLEPCLESLREQDCPNMTVLVIDSGSREDPTPRVAAVFPEAFIAKLDRRASYGAASNEVLSMVEGASHYLLCHDDVALDPTATRLLLEEAFRSNAGIASPKFVEWDDPDRLLAVGATTDRVGVVRPLIESGELDQGQHDAVREVLVAPAGAMLARADLFAALSGFDARIDGPGDDVDISWRARLAGARVVVVPAARVRHLEASRKGVRAGSAPVGLSQPPGRRAEANRLRTLTACYRWFDLLWAIPLAVFWMLGEAATYLFKGRGTRSVTPLGSLWDVASHPVVLWRERRRAQSIRKPGATSLRRLQAKGNSRFRSFLLDSRILAGAAGAATHRERDGESDVFAGWDDESDLSGIFGASPQEPVRPAARPQHRAGVLPSRWVWAVLIAVGGVLLFGTRDLIGHELPLVGQLPDTSSGWSGLWSSWWSGWQPAGLGSAAPSSPAMAFLGIGATVLLGAVGVLQHVVVLGPLVVGPLGAYRAARAWGSRRAQVASLVAYAVVPVSYNAVALGHWGGLVSFAAAPWVISWLCRASGEAPYPGVAQHRRWAPVLALGAVTALVAAVAPSFLLVVPLAGIGLLLGSLLSGTGGGPAMLKAAVLGSLAAIVLLLPWSIPVLGSRTALIGPSPGPHGRLGLAQVMLFHTGPFGSGPLGWFLLLAATLPLFVGNRWRLSWAARMWSVALLLFLVVWAGRHGWLPAIPAEVALAPAAAALACSVGLGAAAFELDLPGYRFGWRQLAGTLATVALALASIQLVVNSAGGRWKLPSAGASSVLASLPNESSGDYRILWVGAPDALPLAGLQHSPGVAYGTSYNGAPVLSDQWVSAPSGATPRLSEDLSLAESGLTTRLGHLLAPAGVRYLVLPNHNGPTGSGAQPEPVPLALLAGLGSQTDLRSVKVGDPNYSVFENAAWAPVKAVLAPLTASFAGSAGAADRRALQGIELAGSTPISSGGTGSVVPEGSTVYYGATRVDGWHLLVQGRSVSSKPAFGWAMSFAVPVAGGIPAAVVHFSYASPLWIRLGDIFAILLWLVAVVLLIVDRGRSATEAQPAVDAAWFEPMTLSEGGPRHRRVRERASLSAAPDEQDWSDV